MSRRDIDHADHALTNSAYAAGREAFEAGESDDLPYGYAGAEADEWRQGWYDAYEESR